MYSATIHTLELGVVHFYMCWLVSFPSEVNNTAEVKAKVCDLGYDFLAALCSVEVD